MGATGSKTTSSIDVANEFVTNVTTQVINKHQQSGSGEQVMNFSCEKEFVTALSKECSAANAIKWAAANNAKNDTLSAAILAEKSPACVENPCGVINASQDMNVSISIKDVKDGSIATDIKNALVAKLAAEAESVTKGGIGVTNSQTDALLRLKTHVETNISTSLINDTITTFVFSQKMTSKNVPLYNVNQTMVANAIAYSLITNAIKNDASVALDIEAASKSTSKTSGIDFSLFGGILGSILLFFIGIWLFAKLWSLRGGGGGRGAQVPNVPVQNNQMFNQPYGYPDQSSGAYFGLNPGYSGYQGYQYQ